MSEEMEIESQKQKQVTEEEFQPFKAAQKTYKSFRNTLLIIMVIALSSFYFGFSLIYFNAIDFDTIMTIFSIKMNRSQAEGFLTFCIPLGGLIGSCLSSIFIKNITRRKSILYINAAAFVLGMLIFIPNLKTLILVRIGQGICAGLFSSLVPLLIKQTAPFELYGSLGVVHNTFITIGIFSACLLTYICKLITQDYTGMSFWHILFGFPLITISIQSIILIFIMPFETPEYLISRNQEEQARKVLSYIYKEEFVDQIIKKYQIDPKKQKQAIKSDESGVQESTQELKITKIMSLHVALLQQFVGISAVTIYAGQIASGNLPSVQHILPTLINFQQVITGVTSSFLLTKYGRKVILQAGTLASVITNIFITGGFFLVNINKDAGTVFILLGLIFYILNFGMTLGPIVFVIIPEIVNSKFLPYAVMMNWAGAAISLLFFPIILQYLPNKNPGYLFFFFALWSLASYFINKKYLIETKGKSFKEIQQEYKKLQKKYAKQ